MKKGRSHAQEGFSFPVRRRLIKTINFPVFTTLSPIFKQLINFCITISHCHFSSLLTRIVQNTGSEAPRKLILPVLSQNHSVILVVRGQSVSLPQLTPEKTILSRVPNITNQHPFLLKNYGLSLFIIAHIINLNLPVQKIFQLHCAPICTK